MFDTALTWNDLAFLAQGAGMTLAVTAVAVTAGTVLGILFGVIRFQIGPYWSRRSPCCSTCFARYRS